MAKQIIRTCKTAAVLTACIAAALLLYSCVQNGTPAANPAAVSPALQSQPATAAPTAAAQTPAPAASKTAAATQTASGTAAALAQAVCIKAANVYAQPEAGAKVTGRLKAGDTVDLLARQNSWMQVSAPGAAGYVKRENMVTKSVPAVLAPEGDWAKILVNPWHPLPAGFTVNLADFAGGQVDARILELCQNMFADAKKDGAELKLVDAYRSRAQQSEQYEQKVQSYLAKGYSRSDAEREAATITARPDTSEHQTGLALDVVTPAYTSRDKGFANTRAFAWLNVNAASYGFILRYGQDKENLTGVIYEPWHWRFAGTQAAKEIKETGQCLEEYLGIIE